MSQNPPPVQLVLTARDETRAAIQSAVGGLEQMKTSAAGLQGLLAGATAALAGLAVVQQFRNFVSAAAAMDDLAEKTGASVEKLSALAGVAKISGTSLDVVENSLVRLAKGLAGADEESKGAGNALAALGLKAEDLKNLDTADALKKVADELNKYKDGAGKTALAIDLLGKSGAQALPYLKDLAETQNLQARLTAEQAAQAENLEKNLVRLSTSTTGAWKEFSAAVLPTVDEFVKGLLEAANKSGGLRDEIKRLSADGSIREWAETAAVGVAYVVDAFKNIIALLPVLTAEAKVFASGFELAFAKFKSQNMQSTERERFLAQIRKEKAEAENALGGAVAKFLDTTQFSTVIRNQFAALRAAGGAALPDQKPGLDYTSRVDKAGKEAKDELKGIEAYIAQIREQLVGVTDGEFEKMRQKALDTFGQIDFSKLTGPDKNRFAAAFAQVTEDIDALEERARNMAWAKALADGFKEAAKAAEAADAALAAYNQATSQQAQDLQFEIDMVGKLAAERTKLAAIRRIDLDAQRAVAAIPQNAANRDEVIASIYAGAESAKTSVADLYDTLQSKSRDGFTGLQSAAGEYFNRITNDATNFGQAFTSIMGSVENSFVELAKTGKFEFKSLVSSILAELIRLETRRTITAPISAALAGGGGIGGLLGGLFSGSTVASDAFNGFRPPGFAEGGRPDVGRISMVGENGPELFVPDVAGTVIPNHALGGTSVTNHIAIDARGAEAGVEQRIEQGVKRAVSLSVAAVAAQANRGGSYARSVGRR